MFTKKRLIILAVIIIIGFVVGRLEFRAFLNLMLGGTLFGGNILWVKRKEEKQECLYLFAY